MLHADSSSSSSVSDGAGGFVTRNSNSRDGVVSSETLVGDGLGNVEVYDDSPISIYDDLGDDDQTNIYDDLDDEEYTDDDYVDDDYLDDDYISSDDDLDYLDDY